MVVVVVVVVVLEDVVVVVLEVVALEVVDVPCPPPQAVSITDSIIRTEMIKEIFFINISSKVIY